MDAVQVQRVENEGQARADGLAHQPLPRKGLAHPIAQIDELGGAATDIESVMPPTKVAASSVKMKKE